jgi:ABC-type polysaccharide/polyol phosphate export permease
MAIYGVPITWNVLWFIPILITVFIVTFGFCLFALHIGVFAEDMTNLVNILLRLMFYLTGIFYSLDSINNVVYRTIDNNSGIVIDRKPHLCGLTPRNL